MDQNSPPPPPPPPKSAIPRRGPPLTAIRTDLAQQQQSQLPQPPPQQQQQHQRTRPVLQKPRPQRLRPIEVVANQPPSVPLQPEPTRKVASKTSLRGLFARNKALREERKSETTLPAVGERRGSTTPSTTVPDTPRSVAHTLASGSTLHASSQVATPTESTFTLDRPSRGTRVKPEPKSKVSSSWTPPPLFQAYPQASKHARLAVPNIAPDTILRIHATQAGNFRNPFQPGEAEGGDAEAAKKGKKDAKEKKPVKRGGPNSLDQIVFLKKIFVLVTAGYLLQYSGEGSYDRLPEKIMRLGPASAAFASDSIPGKHHVVQISQKSTDDGTAPAAAGRTFLSRFGLQTAESRRAVRTYLVIMSSAQEMNSWLIALRKTIESLGGKKYVPEFAPGDDSEAPEVPSNTLLAHRGSRLLASRKSSLRESNPPSPLSDSFPLPPSASSTHRKSFYQEEEQEQQPQQPPRIPSPVKTSNRLSISGPLDIVTIPSTTSTFGDSDIIFENPRDAPQPTPSSKSTPSSPPALPPAVETPAQSPAITPRLRKPSTSTSSNPNRRSLNSYTATQLERQGEVARASRPLSFVGSGPAAAPSLLPQNTSLPGPNVQLSLLRGHSSRSILSDDSTSRRTPTLEPASKVPSRTAESQASNIGTKRDSILNTQKRQSLISSSRSATPTNNSAIATARTIPTIPPRKYSLTRSENSESVTPAAGTARYYQQNKLPDMNHTPRLPQQRLAQLTQSRLPSVTEKGRPLTRLPKMNSDSSESTTPASTPPPSNLARLALGKDRANRVSASTSKTREPQSRSTSALNHQQPRQPTTAPSEDQPGLQSRTTTPASSPQTPQTPREESSRRSSIITSQPQSQQTSPRARRNPNLSFLPPAPPPNVPLPEAPPPNIAFRHIPLWQKRHLQQPSHPPQSQLPQPPPLQPPPQQTQQTHLPRPSISSSSLTSAASSPAPPPASSATNQQHSRRRSSELRSLHLQMANMLNNSIMHRKQSDVSLAGTTTTTTTATNTANATPTSEFPPPLNMNMNMNLHPQRRSQSPQKRNDQ